MNSSAGGNLVEWVLCVLTTSLSSDDNRQRLPTCTRVILGTSIEGGLKTASRCALGCGLKKYIMILPGKQVRQITLSMKQLHQHRKKNK